MDSILGLVAGGEGEEVRQVVDVTQPYAVTTIATQATATAYANTRLFPTLLRLAPPNSVVVSDAVAGVLQCGQTAMWTKGGVFVKGENRQ